MSVPLFRSGVESPSQLAARVRRRVGSGEASPRSGIDPEFDLSRGEGLLEGWYYPEIEGGRATRWVERRFEVEAEVCVATHVDMEVRLFAEAGFVELHARFSVNDENQAVFSIRPGWNNLLLPLPPGTSGRVHVAFDAGGDWIPAECGFSQDNRPLSVLVRRVAFVRFVELPLLVPGAIPEVGEVAGAPVFPRTLRGRLLQRLLPKLTSRLSYHEQRSVLLEQRLASIERLIADTSRLVEDRLVRLAESDAQTAAEVTRALDEIRESLGREVARLRN
ncbi:MAG TPA: hypothetical protein VF580_07530 [Thermoanaerobaculia bacterium]